MQMEISALYGMDIYTDKGVYVGKVEDASVDITERRILGLLVKDINPSAPFVTKKKGVIIPYRWVTSVGEVVIIKHITKRVEEPEEEMKEEVRKKRSR